MKNVSLVSATILAFGLTSAAMAADGTQKMVRNDRVTVVKHIPTTDVNPYLEHKKIVRTDRISYRIPKAEHKPVKYQRMARNDHVVIYKNQVAAS